MNFGLVVKDLLMENLMRAQFSGLRRTVENLVISKIMVKQEEMQDSDGISDTPTDELIKRACAIEYFRDDDKAMDAFLEIFEESTVQEMLTRIEEEPIIILNGFVHLLIM